MPAKDTYNSPCPTSAKNFAFGSFGGKTKSNLKSCLFFGWTEHTYIKRRIFGKSRFYLFEYWFKRYSSIRLTPKYGNKKYLSCFRSFVISKSYNFFSITYSFFKQHSSYSKIINNWWYSFARYFALREGNKHFISLHLSVHRRISVLDFRMSWWF